MGNNGPRYYPAESGQDYYRASYLKYKAMGSVHRSTKQSKNSVAFPVTENIYKIAVFVYAVGSREETARRQQ